MQTEKVDRLMHIWGDILIDRDRYIDRYMHKYVRCSYFGSISFFVSITDFIRGAMPEDGGLFTKKGLAEDGGLFTKKGPFCEPDKYGGTSLAFSRTLCGV